MELVCRRRDNCQKEASFGNYFLQLESSKNKDDRFSLHEDFMTCSCVCVCVYTIPLQKLLPSGTMSWTYLRVRINDLVLRALY